MGKFYECIYGYICKTDYNGSCSPADRIYTLSDGMTQTETDCVAAALQNVGRCDLAKIDRLDGAGYSKKEPEPDFDATSFSYLPKRDGEYGVFACASLRKSLKRKNIRGSKELTHALVFDGVPSDFYVIDLMKSRRFSQYADIPLDEAASIEYENEDLVCEVKPELLDKIDWDDFSSRPISLNEVTSLGKKSLKILSEFAHALVSSQKERRTLFVVYNPEEKEEFVAYLCALLKLFPPNVANGLSFITMLGKKSRVSVDICGVPTSDEEYISDLKRDGNVIKITGFDTAFLSGEKSGLAAFLSRATTDDFAGFVDGLERYAACVFSVADMDAVAELYSDSLVKEFDAENPREYLADVCSRIKRTESQIEMISKIEGEAEHRIKSIALQVKEVCGAFSAYTTDDTERLLVDSVLSLYSTLKSRKLAFDGVYEMLEYVLFGLSGQSEELENKHFELLSVCRVKVEEKLGDDYSSFVNVVCRDFSSYKRFFDDYLNKPEYYESSAAFALSIVGRLSERFSVCGREEVETLRFFVSQYLSKNPDKFEVIVKTLFENPSDGDIKELLSFVLDFVVPIGATNRSAVEKRTKCFCDYVCLVGKAEAALYFAKDKFVKRFFDDETLYSFFGSLLERYFTLSGNVTLDDVCSAFEKEESFCGVDSSAGLKRFVLEVFARTVVNPYCSSAVKTLRFDEITKEKENAYRRLVKGLKSPSAKGVVDEKIIAEIETALDKYVVYKSQTALEKELELERVEFVTRELLLLKRKTIYSLLNEYIGSDEFSVALHKADIVDGKPYKNQKFLAVAEEQAKEFLTSGDENKRLALSVAVRRERKKVFRDIGADTRDFIGGLINSTIFAAAMTVIAYFLLMLVFVGVAQSYFKSLYVFASAVIFVTSFILYWSNYKDRRLRSNLMMSLWQSALFVITVIGLLALTQFVLGLIV